MNKRKLGGRYEQTAAAYLRSLGYRQLAANYRCRCGEIDLIFADGNTLVFVEVKYRRDFDYGPGEAHVDSRKQKTIVQVAEVFLLRHGLSDCFCRFDVISIRGNGSIVHIKNAFEKR